MRAAQAAIDESYAAATRSAQDASAYDAVARGTLPMLCQECGQPRQRRTCADCGHAAQLIDCGHYGQPAEIAASAHGGEPVCAGCEITRNELAMTGGLAAETADASDPTQVAYWRAMAQRDDADRLMIREVEDLRRVIAAGYLSDRDARSALARTDALLEYALEEWAS